MISIFYADKNYREATEWMIGGKIRGSRELTDQVFCKAGIQMVMP